MRLALSIAPLVTALGSAACSSEDPAVDHVADATPADAAPVDATPVDVDAAPVVFNVDGVVSGPLAPAAGDTLVVWTAVNPPTNAYVYGEGTQSGARFHVDLRGAMPAGAVIQGLGVGTVVLYPAGEAHPPQGPLAAADVEMARGAATRHAIVYRAPDVDAQNYPWVADFPVGFSCGACVDHPGGKAGFAPTPCDEVEILAPEEWFSKDLCLWQ